MKAILLLNVSSQPSSFRALNGLSTIRVIPVGSALPPGGGGARTEIADVAVFPSLVAVIVAFPGETAATRPVLETVEIPMFEELHVTRRPVSTLLLASRVVAES
jgi:hypothetical protein